MCLTRRHLHTIVHRMEGRKNETIYSDHSDKNQMICGQKIQDNREKQRQIFFG
jgi:hypothetical protein